MVSPSTPDLATGTPADSPLWETQIAKKPMAEASTQTDESVIPDNVSNDSLSSPITLVNVDSEDYERQEETMDELQGTEDTGSIALAEEALSTETAAHQQTREELAQLKEQITAKDTEIETSNAEYLRLQRQSNESRQELEEERDNLREQLEEANSRIDELEDSGDEEHLRRLESEVEDLKAANTQLWGRINDQANIIRVGCKELGSRLRVGTKLHARLNQVDGVLKGSRWTTPSAISAELGSADGLMRSAAKWFPIAVPVQKNMREIQLAIEGPPASFSDSSSSETTSFNTPESPLMESGFTFSSGTPAQETRQENENTAKKPVFDFSGTPAQDSQPKAQSSAKEPAIQSGTPSAQENLHGVPSGVTTPAQVFTIPEQIARPDTQATNVRSKAEPEWADDEEQTEGPAKKSRPTSTHKAPTSVFDFSPSSSRTKAANGNLKTKRTTIFDEGATVNLSPLSPGSNTGLGASVENGHERASKTPSAVHMPSFNFSGKAAKGEEPAPKTVNPLAFGVGIPTQFDFSPSGVMPKFGGLNCNPASASTALSDSKPVVIGGEVKQNEEPTGARTSRASEEATSTPEGRVEGEAPSVIGKLGFNVPALTRIVNSVPSGVLGQFGVLYILGGLVSRGAKPANQAEDDKVDPRNWRSPVMTYAEVIARWTTEYRERAEPPAALLLWREPEWPVTLPPLNDPEPKSSVELPLLALHEPPASSRAPSSSLVAFEEGLRHVMAAIEGLHIGPAAPTQESPPMRSQPATQPAPQPGLQVEDAAPSTKKAPEPMAETGPKSQEQTKDATPKKPPGNLRIWSLRKQR